MAWDPLAQAALMVKFMPRKFENGRQVHRDRRIHCLKNGTGAHQHGIFFLPHDIYGFNRRSG